MPHVPLGRRAIVTALVTGENPHVGRTGPFRARHGAKADDLPFPSNVLSVRPEHITAYHGTKPNEGKAVRGTGNAAHPERGACQKPPPETARAKVLLYSEKEMNREDSFDYRECARGLPETGN